MIQTKFYCDECNTEIDINDGVHIGNETDYAKTEIVLLTCPKCGVEYSYWMDGSNYFEGNIDE